MILILQVNVGDKIDTKQLYTRMGISKNTFFNNKKDILLGLSEAWQYQVEYKGRSTIYHFIKKNYDFQYSRKTRKKTEQSIIRDKVYQESILQTIQERPLNTAANVARILKQEWKQVRDLNYTDGTVYQHVRVRLRKWFGTCQNDMGTFEDTQDLKQRKGYIKRKIWCMLDNSSYQNHNSYKPLSQEQIQDFFEMFKGYRKDSRVVKMQAGIYSDFQAGTITKEERDKAVGQIGYTSFVLAKKEFKGKYGSYPIKVPEYVLY